MFECLVFLAFSAALIGLSEVLARGRRAPA
jgi:hypothetical protein